MTTEIIFKAKILIAIAAIAAALLLVIGGAILLPGRIGSAEDNQNRPAQKTLNVSGQGTVYTTPDIAYVTLGVITEDKVAKIAQQSNADCMSKIVASIKSLGIKAEDIKTVSYSIYPKYDYNKDTGESKIVGYTVNNSIQVTVRDISKAGSVIDAASDSGANISNSISFGLSDYEKYYNEALKEAVKAAKTRAETIADVLGVALKSPLTITENGGYEPVRGYGAYDDMYLKAQAAPTPVEAGTITVKANVSMVYEY